MSTEDSGPSSAESKTRTEHRDRTGRRGGRGVGGWVVDTVYDGVTEVWLFGLPALYLGFVLDSASFPVARGALTVWVVGTLVVGAYRSRFVDREWPAVDRRQFTVGDGYRDVLVRSVYWSATYAVAGFGGALLELATGSAAANVAVAAGVAAPAVALLPAGIGRARRVRAVRVAFASVGVALGAVLATPLSVGSPMKGYTLLLFAGLVLVDAWPLVWTAVTGDGGTPTADR